eukprot:4109894-Prymnesium_polylepis.1
MHPCALLAAPTRRRSLCGPTPTRDPRGRRGVHVQPCTPSGGAAQLPQRPFSGFDKHSRL